MKKLILILALLSSSVIANERSEKSSVNLLAEAIAQSFVYSLSATSDVMLRASSIATSGDTFVNKEQIEAVKNDALDFLANPTEGGSEALFATIDEIKKLSKDMSLLSDTEIAARLIRVL